MHIEGTETREGNIAVTAAMTAAAIDHPSIRYFSKAINMPMISEWTFFHLKKYYVESSIKEIHSEQKDLILERVIGAPPEPMDIAIAIDAQYDSPGYSAELACETVMHVPSKLILAFAITHKSEVEGVSNRMELRGAEKVITELQEWGPIASVTTDKHAGVIKFLRESGLNHRFDLWHLLQRLSKKIRAVAKKLDTPEDTKLMLSLRRRLLIHSWNVLDLAENDPERFKELVFAFFLHVSGVHSWQKKAKFEKLFKIASTTTTSKGFKALSFKTITACPHETLDADAAAPIDAQELALQSLLEILSKTIFLNHLAKVKDKHGTSSLESYHSLRLRYAPKRKYFNKKGQETKTMLANLHWNTTQLAELEGKRKISASYMSHSKARDEQRQVTRKEVVEQPWMRQLVLRSIEGKRQQGAGQPTIEDEHRSDDDDDDDNDEMFKGLMDEDDDDDDNSNNEEEPMEE
jgi:solute carrier family 8 (sodium/calcium exchanger)